MLGTPSGRGFNPSNVARRYLPLAALIAVQVLIIALAPSKAANQSAGSNVGTGPVQGYSVGNGSANGAGAAALANGTATGAGGTAGTSGTGAAGGAAGSAGSTATGGGASHNSPADVTHCAGSREFSPTIDFYAPPCTPGTIGGTYSNGGATSQGVSASTITMVDYITNYGAEINAVLQAEGLLETYQQAQVVDQAWQNFLNAHYVLWGRKIKIVPYQGTCQSAPPNDPCLFSEMDSIVQQYHPYAVYWDTTVCSACFARLAQDHTIGLGGDGFSDAFAQANAPYIWSQFESSTRIEVAFAHWWCNQMTSNSSNRVVSFAPAANPAQNFNGQKRVLGVISPNDPDNEDTIQNVLVPALNQCGDGGSISQHHYYYDQNINTVAAQVSAGIAAMDTTTNPATDVACICDPVAPQFVYEGEQQHNYWPENVLADVQDMTYDMNSQNYGATQPGNQPSPACPSPPQGCEFDDAFGVMSTASQEPQTNDAGVRVYKLGGGTNLPVTPMLATELWENWNMIGSLIENTGPDLTPARMAAAAPSLGTIGGGTTGEYQVGFTPGSYFWQTDARVAYWDKNKASPYNGAPGTWVSIEGSRFLANQYPVLSEPPIPAVRPS